MEDLDYLIRTITYHRSSKELDRNKQEKGSIADLILQAEIVGLQFALTEIYKLLANKEE